jgi:hypothetical protein
MGPSEKMRIVAKAWDCDLPENPYLRARYWTDKAVAAEIEAARRTGPEAAAWLVMAKSWRNAIDYLRYPPLAVPHRTAPRTSH